GGLAINLQCKINLLTLLCSNIRNEFRSDFIQVENIKTKSLNEWKNDRRLGRLFRQGMLRSMLGPLSQVLDLLRKIHRTPRGCSVHEYWPRNVCEIKLAVGFGCGRHFRTSGSARRVGNLPTFPPACNGEQAT